MHRGYAWLGMALLAGLAGCGRKAPAPAPPVPVTTAPAVAKTMPLELEAMGVVEAYNSLEIRPRVTGQILRLHYREGEEILQDALLVSLDPAPFQEALREAEARLAGDEATLRFQAGEAERKSRLVGDGGVSRSESERAQAAAKAQQDRVQADRAIVEQARLNLGYCSIRSPIPGRAGAHRLNLGAVVEAHQTVLLVVNQVEPIYVTFAVPERDLPAVRVAREQAELAVTARVPGADAPRQGRLTFIDNAVDPATGMIRLKGAFANADGFLWPGQYVRVALTIGEEPGAVVVPAAAVARGPKGEIAFVVRPDGTAELRAVRVRRTAGDEAVLDGGVAPGETVVTDGLNKLKDGAAVLAAAPPVPAAADGGAGLP